MNLFVFSIIVIIFILLPIIKNIIEENRLEQMRLEIEKEGINAYEFLKLARGNKHIKKRGENDFKGVYILYNKTKKMFYIGQSVNVYDRVYKHLTGSGNGDVYADFKYGDLFLVKTIRFEKRKHNTLNDLEKLYIKKYNSYAKGYNKTRGGS